MQQTRTSLPRRLILAFAACLVIGCMLVPVEESRFGSPATLRFTSDHRPYATRDILFSHEVHAHIECDACHFATAAGAHAPAESDTASNAAPDTGSGAATEGAPDAGSGSAASDPHGVALPSMALCFGCHDGKSAPSDCITCHIVNRRYRKPEFHDGLFPRHHRRMAEEEDYKCELCHLERECKSCHAERRPLSHTPRFERSTHGRMATHDRRSCAVCHETAFCENCHSQPPPDHTAIFMRGGGHRQAALIRGRSCLTCHRFEEACAQCHG